MNLSLPLVLFFGDHSSASMSMNLFRSVAAQSSKLQFLRSKGVIVCVSNNYYGRSKIGSREVVGFGLSGEYSYADRMDFPCPAIRFREVKGDLTALKEKEKGDWKKLSVDEKKQR